MHMFSIEPIARIQSDFPSKFGIPRQSGLVAQLRSTIIFEPQYRNADALRGMEDFSHLWLIWQFSENIRTQWSPTVRPPRLGGNTRLGVFATRSPFRPNNLGLSCVKLIGLEQTREYGMVIHVAGADLMDGTPIFDIKPYIPYSDCHPDALGGFTDATPRQILQVEMEPSALEKLPEGKEIVQSALNAYLHDAPVPQRLPYQAFAGRMLDEIHAAVGKEVQE